jgi:hypothetical protein
MLDNIFHHKIVRFKCSDISDELNILSNEYSMLNYFKLFDFKKMILLLFQNMLIMI